MNPRRAVLLCAALCIAGLPGASRGQAVARVPVDRVERDLHYTVRGSDAAALAREMAELGPQHPTGRRAWAYTAWELRSRYALELDGRNCRLLDPTVVLEVRTTLPRWEPKAVVTSRLRSNWRRMLVKAAEHERMHRRHAMDAADAAAAAIARVPATGECAALEGQMRSALRRASAAAARRGRLYDRDTDYGRLQGVRLGD